jgi:hypothetical protein
MCCGFKVNLGVFTQIDNGSERVKQALEGFEHLDELDRLMCWRGICAKQSVDTDGKFSKVRVVDEDQRVVVRTWSEIET